jgi:hypothetical protein
MLNFSVGAETFGDPLTELEVDYKTVRYAY